jgi:hypothetical protein
MQERANQEMQQRSRPEYAGKVTVLKKTNRGKTSTAGRTFNVFRTVMEKIGERSVARQLGTSAPLIVVSQVVRTFFVSKVDSLCVGQVCPFHDVRQGKKKTQTHA